MNENHFLQSNALHFGLLSASSNDDINIKGIVVELDGIWFIYFLLRIYDNFSVFY